MRTQVALLAAALLLPHYSHAQGEAATESRDAASAFIGSMQFTVGRFGRDCLTMLNRAETPQEYVSTWLERNGRYTSAAATYIQVRLAEAEAKGQESKISVLQQLASVRSTAEENISSMYAKNGKESVCRRMIALIDTGAYDIKPGVPTFPEIEALLNWAQKR